MKNSELLKRFFVTMAVSVSALCASGWRGETAAYLQTDLVSDLSGLAAVTDSNLVNPWGLAHLSTSPFWVANQGTSTATLYAVMGSTNVSKVPLTVSIPKTASGPQGPTGQVANGGSGFPVNGAPALFMFANLNGTISAWNPSTGMTAAIQAATPGAVYTGLAISQSQGLLYAANNAGGRIDVFNSSFSPASLGAGAFATPPSVVALEAKLGLTLVPFNVQEIGGNVYVTYAPAGHGAQISAALGAGAVAIFNETGTLERTLIDSHLAAPWGVVLAPAGFGQFGSDLLVGNFSYAHSFISAFNPLTDTFVGMIPVDVGNGNTAGGLWSLEFGNAGANGSTSTLFFTDGIDGETHGLFGAITPTPLPAALPLFATGLGALGLLGWRKKRRRDTALS